MKIKALIIGNHSFNDCYIVDFLPSRDSAYPEPIAICVLTNGQIITTSISNLTIDHKALVAGDN